MAVDAERRAFYLKHIYKKVWKESEIKRQKKIKAVAYKGGKCERCEGIFHPCVYDFHHSEAETKEASGSQFLGWTWERIKSEIDKCQLLCANCHRLEHCTYVDGYNNKKGNNMNEKENTMELAHELAQVDAPSLVPSEEWIGEAVLVQTEAETGTEDRPVKGQAELLAERG